MKTIAELEDEIIADFEWFEDPMDRYEEIIERGKKLAPLKDAFHTDDFLVKGCQSKVWLHAYEQDGRIYYEADSNTAITKGIIALLVKVLSGQTPDDILNCPLSFIDKIQLRSHLSSQRSNGLTAMVQKMKAYAAAYKS